jgi:hypothetical protein
MGERKVLNNYIPPDFDPSILPKFKRNRDKLIEVRMMLPFSMRCNTCGEYMYMGKKFNSKSEIVKGEDYMGIRKFRFYIKCSVCSAEITFKTDPQNSGYTCESGASRNFEMWRDTEEATAEAKKTREEEDAADAMKALENRTMDSKIEMDVLDALDEIKAINQRHERIDTNKLISTLHAKAAAEKEKELAAAAAAVGVDARHVVNKATGLTAADEDLIKSIKFKNSSSSSGSCSNGGDVVNPLTLSSSSSVARSEGTDFISVLNQQMAAESSKQSATSIAATTGLGTTIIRKKRKIDTAAATGGGQAAAIPAVAGSGASSGGLMKMDTLAAAPAIAPPVVAAPVVAVAPVTAMSGGLGGLLGAYGSGSDED